MSNFKEISCDELGNAFKLIGKDWMLITASDGSRINTMTASWGSFGVLWGVDVCTVFVRPSRYTFGIIEETDKLTLSFFDEKYRDALKICGKLSGRDCDKFKQAGLTTAIVDRAPIICEADTVIICRKLYCDDVRPEGFVDAAPHDKYYGDGDLHRMYVCRIEKVLKKI